MQGRIQKFEQYVVCSNEEKRPGKPGIVSSIAAKYRAGGPLREILKVSPYSVHSEHILGKTNNKARVLQMRKNKPM